MSLSFLRLSFVGALALGLTSLLCQVLLLRELIAIFYGNELAVGLMLSCWMTLVALGSWVPGTKGRWPRALVLAFLLGLWAWFGGVVLSNVKGLPTWKLSLPSALTGLGLGAFLGLLVWPRLKIEAEGALSLSFLLVALSVYPLLSLTRCLKTISGHMPWDMANPFFMLGGSILILSPLCLLLGAQFTLLCGLASRSGAGKEAPGWIYLTESVGFVVAGLAFNLLLVKYLQPFAVALVVALSGAACSFLLSLATKGWLRATVGALSGMVGLAFSFSPLFGLPGKVNLATARLQWKGLDLGDRYYFSRYGNLAIIRIAEQHTFYQNSVSLFSLPAYVEAEEYTHVPLGMHPHPKSLLILGGGLGGVLRKALEHPLRKIVYVELDPLVVEVARKFAPPEDKRALSDPRVRILLMDARRFVKVTKEKFDVVLALFPDPYNALLNRFYTVEFLREVKRLLNWGGVLCITMSSGESYISPEHKALNASIYKACKTVFDEVLVLPGGEAMVFCTTKGGSFPRSGWEIFKRLEGRGVSPEYLDPVSVDIKFWPDRQVPFKKAVEGAGVSANRDFWPICYFFNLLLWTAELAPVLKVPLLWASKFPLWGFVALAVLLLALALWRGRSPTGAAVLCVLTAGLAGMVLEISLLFAYQVVAGYVYEKVALMVVAFMLGLAVAARFSTRFAGANPPEKCLSRISLTEGMVIAITLLSPFLALGIAKIHPFLPEVASELAFAALIALSGVLAGYMFPLASAVVAGYAGDVKRAAGLLYAADLVGGTFGALAVSIVWLPIYGFFGACFVAALLNLPVLAFVLVARR